jgi:chemotaxis protein MotA
MDILSFIGVILAFMAIIGGNWMEGGHIAALANGPAFAIVFGGTLGAILLQTPLTTFVRAIRMSGTAFVRTKLDHQEMIKKMVGWGNVARKEGLLSLEDLVEREPDAFVRKGMQLLVDGGEPSVIRELMEVELEAREEEALRAAKVFTAMGGYSPTIGIIGAVMGLIHVMQNLADPSKLGAGIATAFVATIYGVGLANLFFLPLGTKLKHQVMDQTQYYRMATEGIISIAEGENPRLIEIKMQGFLQ